MALEGTDLLVVQKQSGDNGMRKLTVSDLSTFISNEQPITFRGTANATVANDEPATSEHVDGYLYINNANAAGDFAWTAGTDPFTGTIYKTPVLFGKLRLVGLLQTTILLLT